VSEELHVQEILEWPKPLCISVQVSKSIKLMTNEDNNTKKLSDLLILKNRV
jgi:hypothetical protein